MLVDVQAPVQGLTITEATLVRWMKEPGERVEAGEPLFEMETDKAAQEIESPATGTLLNHGAAAGEVVKLGAVIGYIGTEPGATLPDGAGTGTEAHPTTAGAETGTGAPPAQASASQRLMVSPRARRAAERLGVDLAAVRPTGGRGRHVRERDVLAAAQQKPVRVVPAPVPPPPTAGKPLTLTRARRVTAERTAASFHDAPHFYLTREVLAERLVALREDLASEPAKSGGVRVTLTDLLVKALALAIHDCPYMNVQWHDGQVLPLASIDIGLATGTPSGLYVPVIRSADGLTIAQLAGQRADLVDRARRGALLPDEMAGGSFTLTNLGRQPVDQFQAVINPPQSGILATGTVEKRPFVVDGQLGAYHTVVLTASLDHRVVDGAEAAEFLARIVHYIERPGLLLIAG